VLADFDAYDGLAGNGKGPGPHQRALQDPAGPGPALPRLAARGLDLLTLHVRRVTCGETGAATCLGLSVMWYKSAVSRLAGHSAASVFCAQWCDALHVAFQQSAVHIGAATSIRPSR